MIYGYARVSTKEQSEARQIEALLKYVSDKKYIFVDKASGKDFNREQYIKLVGTEHQVGILHEGDTLVILSFDRLGRKYDEMLEQWRYITQELKVNVKVLDLPILDFQNYDDITKKLMTDMFLAIFAYVAERERLSILERQRQGIATMEVGEDGKLHSIKPNKKSRPIGRPNIVYPKRWAEEYFLWKSGQKMAFQVMKDLGLKRTTFYKFANSYPKKLAMEYIDKHIKKGAEVSLEECCELIHIDIDVDTFKKYQEEYNNTVAILKSAKKREDIITARKRYTKMMNGE